MLAKRIIPCLDVDNGRVKKGVNFVNLVDVGSPVEIAREYEAQGADELVFLDITATNEKRKTLVDVVEVVSKEVFMPLTVGGGISSLEDMEALLQAGADKISLNSSAVAHPILIKEGAEKFGSQCIVVAIDAKYQADTGIYKVYTHGGKVATDYELVAWAKKVVSLGAGELLVTIMDADGTKNGFAIPAYQALGQAVQVPMIASGGAGNIQDFVDVFKETSVTGALAASVFHFGQLTVDDVKEALAAEGIAVRRI